ncbi:EamA family transporter [Paenibacillus polymyxa]|nr:EamA family transporter [Paenibacillus polymyxa]
MQVALLFSLAYTASSINRRLIGLVNILAIMLKLAAFYSGVTGIVSAIISLSVVVVLLCARFYLKEKMSRQEIFGLNLALIGIIVIKMMV